MSNFLVALHFQRVIISATKNPLWLGNGVRTFVIGSFVILCVVTVILLSIHITSIWKPEIAICPIYLMILPFGSIASNTTYCGIAGYNYSISCDVLIHK